MRLLKCELEVFEMWTLRRMEKVSWTEHIKTNEEVLETKGPTYAQ